MKHLTSSCMIAFSTYSRIPTPRVEWNEENMRHILAFFPLVGAAVGAAFWGADALCRLLELGDTLRAALLTAVPAAVTGGIHLDGYCDTVDALASHASREKKLAILKDSGAGAFAMIWCCVWFLLYFALLTELGSIATVAACFVLSRSFSALGVDRLPSARPITGPQAGMGSGLKRSSRFPRPVLAGYLTLWAGAVWLWGEPVPALAALAAAVCFYFIYKKVALRQFGGFTGDLAGWFLQICELVMLAAAVLAERVIAVWF
ncbi:MAG: adenosylcobinamide-GDP ribazoletransferase [Oscillospiraceae bacterium]|nr:adenosylcobinamide-GDP ribazoletransferase [Oscillospiraceae bacterium]